MVFYKYYCLFVGLLDPVIAIEPNAGLVEKCSSKDGVRGRLSSAEEMLNFQELGSFDKTLFCCVAHHFNNPEESFRKLLSGIHPSCICLIMNFSSQLTAYLWKAAREVFFKGTKKDILKSVADAGFDTHTFLPVITFRCTKAQWYSKLRGRIFSTIELFSDEEIEEGFAELEQTSLKGVGLEEEIEVQQEYCCTVARPPQGL